MWDNAGAMRRITRWLTALVLLMLLNYMVILLTSKVIIELQNFSMKQQRMKNITHVQNTKLTTN